MFSLRILLATVCLHFIPTTPLQAGGVMLYEIGSQDVGLASAGWSARAEDPSTAFTNPAGMSRLCTRELELGIQPIYADINFNPNSSTTVRGDDGDANAWIPAGGTYYVQPINASWTAGISALGYFGSKLNYNHEWVGRYYVTETTLQGFSLVPAISTKITDKFSIGIGANVMYGIFSQSSAINNKIDHMHDGKLKLSDDNFGFGCVLGLLYELTPCSRIGLQYLSNVRLHFDAKPHFEDIGPVLKGALKTTGLLNSRLLLEVNVPQMLMFSVYHDILPCLAIMANIGWQEWSQFQKATVSLNSPTNISLTTTPHYKNTWHGAIGLRCKCDYGLIFSGGFAYDTSAVSSKNRTLDFPVGAQRRYGAGVEWEYSDTLQLGLQYEYQDQGNLKVNVNKGPLTGHVSGEFQDVSIQFINLNLQWMF